jgi:Domain of unknown function (DUF4352)/zinc-ribbon domain
MFCRTCGANLKDGANFCTACGTRTDLAGAIVAPPQSPPRRSRLWLYVAAAFGLLLMMSMCSAILNHSSTQTTATQPTSEPESSPPSSTARHKIGESFSVGYWSYRCNGARWHSSIGSEYSRQYPDAKFLVVDLAVRNNDKTASVLAPLKLVDAEGREYDESSKGIFLDNSFGMLKSVNPGVTSSGYIAFDVPPGNYALKVSGGFTSGQNELIDLQ